MGRSRTTMYSVFRTKYSALLTSTLIAALAGCAPSGPTRAPIQGKVTVGGQPLAAGRILFTPAAPNQGPATSARIEAGQYKIAKSEGPIVGKNRVEVEADLNLGFPIDDEAAFAKRGGKPLPPNPIPPAFNSQSNLTADVKAGEENAFDIAIPALPKKR
jgi:hypothetical protein